MKLHKLLSLALVPVLLFSLVACGKSDPSATTDPTTAAPLETTAPPTTGTLVDTHIPLTEELLFQIRDETYVEMETNNTIVVPANTYSHVYAVSSGLVDLGLAESGNGKTITVHVSNDSRQRKQQCFLIMMSRLIAEHPDCWWTGPYSGSYQVEFFCDFERVGCETAEEYYNLSQRPMYEGRTEISFVYTDGYISLYVLYVRKTDNQLLSRFNQIIVT